jgi:hypothetical protein
MAITMRIWRESIVTYFRLLQGYQQLPENTEKTRGTARGEPGEPEKFGIIYFVRIFS